ncbi:MAG: hypothetical protein DRO07_02180 [Candidatus Iainarchaeum archaeon]|uniref:Mechanosensitive ion channel n=1 Tax=Candidatus Iainarchaeum sp. TaxID=3101447 RepID=A0A497JFL1_9ARCH|nr:MAG: hypothetical protein DRO07_02180 [Candidatus Diapherotrites archaeon]
MVNVTGETVSIVQSAFGKLAEAFAEVLPSVLGLVILLLVGYVVGVIIKRIVMGLLANMRVDEWLEEQNLADVVAGHTITNIIGTILEWSIILLFLAQGAEVMQYEVFKSALQGLVFFVFQVIGAVLIGLAGLIIARYVRNALEVSATRFRKIIALAAEVLIIYMALVMALKVVPGIDTTILEYAFIIGFGSVAFAGALALGLAFGLAFKDEAKNMLKEWEKPKKRKKK